MSNNEAPKEVAERDPRFYKRKTFPEEKKIQDIVKEAALKACKQEVRDFVDCEQANGLMVIFNCRLQNKLMNDCMRRHMTDDHHGEVRLKRVLEREAAKKEREAREAAERKAQEEAENAASKTKGWFS